MDEFEAQMKLCDEIAKEYNRKQAKNRHDVSVRYGKDLPVIRKMQHRKFFVSRSENTMCPT